MLRTQLDPTNQIAVIFGKKSIAKINDNKNCATSHSEEALHCTQKMLNQKCESNGLAIGHKGCPCDLSPLTNSEKTSCAIEIPTIQGVKRGGDKSQ